MRFVRPDPVPRQLPSGRSFVRRFRSVTCGLAASTIVLGSALGAQAGTAASPSSSFTGTSASGGSPSSSFNGSGTTGGPGEGEGGPGSDDSGLGDGGGGGAPGVASFGSAAGTTTMPVAAVRRLQAALARLGYFHHVVTGYYGPVTTAAVRRFQRSAGLKPDGIWGPLSRAALKRRLAGR